MQSWVLRERKRRLLERLAFWAAWHVPRWLVYFAAIRLWAHATTGPYGDTEAPAITVAEAIDRWEVPRRRPNKRLVNPVYER